MLVFFSLKKEKVEKLNIKNLILQVEYYVEIFLVKLFSVVNLQDRNKKISINVDNFMTKILILIYIEEIQLTNKV